MKLPDGYMPPEEWWTFPNGLVGCWWCAALCHPDTVSVHDGWHRRLEQDDPIGKWPVPA